YDFSDRALDFLKEHGPATALKTASTPGYARTGQSKLSAVLKNGIRKQVKVLNIVPSLLPQAGGPSRIVPGLCDGLVDTGVEVTLFTTHQEPNDLTIDPQAERYHVSLFSGTETSLKTARAIYESLRRCAREFDVIHVHSLWNLVSSAAC